MQLTFNNVGLLPIQAVHCSIRKMKREPIMLNKMLDVAHLFIRMVKQDKCKINLATNRRQEFKVGV